MKIIRILTLFLFVIAFSCSDDDNSNIENGINPNPNLKVTGSSANAFLSSENYESLIVEIFYVKDFRPTTLTLNNFRNFMTARINKPGGITFIETEIDSQNKSTYSLDEIAGIEKNIRSKYNSPNVLTMFVLFIDGKSEKDIGNSFTLGSAYRNTSFVIYENSVRFLAENVAGANTTRLETTVLLHEFCHLLGLVDFGTKMQTQHRDIIHGQHCENEDCLMYWQTENNLLAGNIDGIPQLDTNCISDLRANGGK